MNWDQLLSATRFGQENLNLRPHARTEFQRDYDRLIFSPSFRRLQNKTQVFPLPGAIFVHNRLTHSLEVASVGRSLANNVSIELLEKYNGEEWTDKLQSLDDIVATACLAHDMGNPPFGHSGERAIISYFKEGEGQRFQDVVSPHQWADLTHFDSRTSRGRVCIDLQYACLHHKVSLCKHGGGSEAEIRFLSSGRGIVPSTGRKIRTRDYRYRRQAGTGHAYHRTVRT